MGRRRGGRPRAAAGDDALRRRTCAAPRRALASFNAARARRRGWSACSLLEEPPDIDAGEITDKGYVNQRAVLERRADAVERLFAEPPDPAVIVAAG